MIQLLQTICKSLTYDIDDSVTRIQAQFPSWLATLQQKLKWSSFFHSAYYVRPSSFRNVNSYSPVASHWRKGDRDKGASESGWYLKATQNPKKKEKCYLNTLNMKGVRVTLLTQHQSLFFKLFLCGCMVSLSNRVTQSSNLWLEISRDCEPQ